MTASSRSKQKERQEQPQIEKPGRNNRRLRVLQTVEQPLKRIEAAQDDHDFRGMLEGIGKASLRKTIGRVTTFVSMLT